MYTEKEKAKSGMLYNANYDEELVNEYYVRICVINIIG